MRSILDCFFACFTGSNADHLFKVRNKYFTVTNSTGFSSRLNSINSFIQILITNDYFYFNFWKKINNIFCTTV